jgi:CubicO group peptidase (beta-lactamase class C family)
LTKPFVAAAVLLLVEDGKLSLTDDVRKDIPQLPDYGHKIMVDHLLTHTSGIRDWTGILPLTAGKDDALTVILRQRGLNFAPGEEWLYSNSGYVLLKEIVARRSGMSFDEFTRKRLFEPLGMKNTAYRTTCVRSSRTAHSLMTKGATVGGWRCSSTTTEEAAALCSARRATSLSGTTR